jgi:hypothetical protein
MLLARTSLHSRCASLGSGVAIKTADGTPHGVQRGDVDNSRRNHDPQT